MERLTHWNKKLGRYTTETTKGVHSRIAQRLGAYENTGITPDQLAVINEEYEKMAKELAELRKQNQWIPVSERLPEDGKRVLATHEGGLNPNRQVIEHYFHNGQFMNNWAMDTDVHSSTFGKCYMGDVIAWMPLPEPYKE